MQTIADKAITDFMLALLEEGDTASHAIMSHAHFDNLVQTLLDNVRSLLNLDVVYIMKQLDDKYEFAFIYESCADPKYSNGGITMHLSPEGLDEVLHMYDKDSICGYNVSDMHKVANDVSDCIMHYGFARPQCGRYDGSIGFQMFTPHTWQDNEREVLLKLGRLFKMIFSVPIAEGVQNQLLNDLETEKRQYHNALSEGAQYTYRFDVTDGLIRERVITMQGYDIISSLGFMLPAGYDEVSAAFLARPSIHLTDEHTRPYYSCAGLLDYFKHGVNTPGAEYYDSDVNMYIRETAYLQKDETTRHVNALIVANDITAERQEEKRRRDMLEDAFKAANSANEAKTRFLEQMSHDIRTPMNGIIGMTEIAKANLGNETKVKDCLSKISRASEHLLSIVGEVLDISKIESGRVNLNLAEFSISDMLESISSIILPQAKARGHKFTIKNGIKHDRVVGDRARLERALINFLGNAIKYTDDGGQIRLEADEQTQRMPHHSDGTPVITGEIIPPVSPSYKFIIADNGFGMSEEFVKHVFEPFARADEVLEKGIQGTGLGMSIANNTIQMMNGSIKVHSKLGRGTTFTVKVCLPIANCGDDGECGSPCNEKCGGCNHPCRRRLLRGCANQTFDAPKADSHAEVSALSNESNVANEKKEKIQSGAKIINGAPVIDAYRGEFAGKRILVVEDNELNREIAMEILAMMGIDSECAENGKEAVDMAERANAGYYDAILMDVRMPVMNGLEAARAIRKIDSKLPIIAMTAGAFSEDVDACMEAGMNMALSKPINISALGKALETSIKSL